jgi:hypothetical protein
MSEDKTAGMTHAPDIERIRQSMTPTEKFIRRGDSAESLNAELRLYEEYIEILLRELNNSLLAMNYFTEKGKQ